MVLVVLLQFWLSDFPPLNRFYLDEFMGVPIGSEGTDKMM